MKPEEIMQKKLKIAEKRIQELMKAGDLKKLSGQQHHFIARFYEDKSNNRLQTAKLILSVSHQEKLKQTLDFPDNYTDYSEAVAAAYYAMYYTVHAYLASQYKTKLRDDLRGVHAITHHIVLYYLVKTKKLAKHLYQEFLATLETTAEIYKITIEDFQQNAFDFASQYDDSRDSRETFTYKVTKNAEEHEAEHAIKVAEEFISTVRQLMYT